jgi:hypothetical protein
MAGNPFFSRKVFAAIAVVVAIGLWYAFRPEKLFVNQKVSEAPSAAIANAQPLFTGSLRTADSAPETHGRVNILPQGDGTQLEVKGLDTKATGPYAVSIMAGDHAFSVGSIQAGATAGRFIVPADAHPAESTKVTLSDASQHTIATASLEAF